MMNYYSTIKDSYFNSEIFYKDLAIKCLTSAFAFHYKSSISSSNYKNNLRVFLVNSNNLGEYVCIKSILGYMVKALTDEDVDTDNKYNHIKTKLSNLLLYQVLIQVIKRSYIQTLI
ncbi:hypothetical protein BCR36DRAFT_163919 [Piromyces finnis]|uniref:Uncharacterized protein n=1 Tax=Piromyces finnis TaxID=1754191 RepID=A0A1Y1VIS7_9FUNG|nr:hypothetical protein BCR36DRAFT_163919 [Piromyces finnis]|eukprot:ORX56588.1 hypothetical protein BCR36DRAFT_163919 [Piromyces finnis]